MPVKLGSTELERAKREKCKGRTYDLRCKSVRHSLSAHERLGGRYRKTGLAIYHFSMKPISRRTGRSSVAAAAYRAGDVLTNERDGVTHDFTAKNGVVHAEIILPEGADASWARDRSALWNFAEACESRIDARTAREFEIALPHELTPEQQLEAVRALAQDLANRYGAAVDFAIHAPDEASDMRNTHAHLLMTTRQVTARGMGEKTQLERKNSWLLSNDFPTTDMQLKDLRLRWEVIANTALVLAGHDIRIDHRSHQARGLEIAPTQHMGVHATQMERAGLTITNTRLSEEAARRNAQLIREKPEQILTLITGEKSVFDRHDIARALHRCLSDDPHEFQLAFARVMASPELVQLQAERRASGAGAATLARYSTKEMVAIERGMIESAARLHATPSHRVAARFVQQAVTRQDAALSRSSGDPAARLSDEQRAAIAHITGPERIAAVVGFAGAGKSTMLAAAREAWEEQGYRVHGAALSGKAAEGLEESSGIGSRTLASWARSWENGRHNLEHGDIFVIDEAGMLGSRQLARFITEAEGRGAKIVLVGDHEQLQAIGAGAAFRAISDQIGSAQLSEIRRQREEWQREASIAFATERTSEALGAYHKQGAVRFGETAKAATAALVDDYLADRAARPDGSRVAMAHRRDDVRSINDAIRYELQSRGELGGEEKIGARSYETNAGKREFAPGDRIVFLENNRDLGVKNGMLGTVEAVEAGRLIARLDGREDASVSIPTSEYQSFDHGYATTIHKNQGATVDRAFVFASRTMDRHLTYVAMTRHRDEVTLYAASEEFTNAGRLVCHGAAPYENKRGGSDSYFVTLEDANGEQRTIWGVDLERAIETARTAIGERIVLENKGDEPVVLPGGSEGRRNVWEVVAGDEIAYRQLEKHLSRAGVKETTLDYPLAAPDAEAAGHSPSERTPEREASAAQDSAAPDRAGADGVPPEHSDGRSAAGAEQSEDEIVELGGERVNLTELAKDHPDFADFIREQVERTQEIVEYGGERVNLTKLEQSNPERADAIRQQMAQANRAAQAQNAAPAQQREPAQPDPELMKIVMQMERSMGSPNL